MRSIKILDDIDARIKAATPGPWGAIQSDDDDGEQVDCWNVCQVASGCHGPAPDGHCHECVASYISGSNADFIAHASIDVPLLSRLVRIVAEANCTAYRSPRGCSIGFPSGVNTYIWPNPEDWWRENACIPCKVRRELESAKCS